ncbi:uncharacterized protein [Apostichopus japonicus]|uniref:uncharacterized protein n=1 Tax=Stichopus japonicus TaxID=307972 RepID=UPI003AB68FF3
MAAYVIVAVVFNIVVFLIGFFGNSLVVYVYTKKRVQSSTTILIRTLAFSDLLVCLLRLGAVYHWTHETSYTVKFLCPLFLSSSFFSVFSSVFVTVAIAVDRFYAVCRAGRRGITPFLARVVSVGCVSVAVLLASPALYVYGTVTVSPNVSVCTAIHPVPVLVIQGLLVRICYVISITIITVMYIRVYITIRSKAKVLARHRRTDPSHGTIADTSTAVVGQHTTGSLDEDDMNTLTTTAAPPASVDILPNTVAQCTNDRPIHLTNATDDTVQPSGNRQTTSKPETGTLKVITTVSNNNIPRLQATSKGKLQRRTTFMLLMTTIVLFVTWLPSTYLRYISRDTRAAIINSGPLAHSLLIMGEYLFFINNAINPVIYAFVNRRFREDCRKVFLQVKRRFLSRPF